MQTSSISKPKTGLQLPVMEQFYTIQGEGSFTGCAAYFIRLAGCDVGCVWCDVKESWNAEGYPVLETTDLAEVAKESGTEIVVVTGGEPAMYDLNSLTSDLQNKGLRTHIETSGTHPIRGNWHWVCFSPKKFKKPLPEAYEKADELKVVIFNKHDFKWAETHAELVRKDCLLYLQPEWSKAEEMMPLITAYVKENPRWKISLQTHKYLGIP
ncbi:radical SAM protein [Cryomorpha ignava]|uniref:7-carboxy-7-deazaguanine synthase n=2 Tax=Cryomorpha ignava TaxID=101383 RepID=A0A7K3WQ82_9FLAO|nr:radical SAM protein [Cryomorpha ignava]